MTSSRRQAGWAGTTGRPADRLLSLALAGVLLTLAMLLGLDLWHDRQAANAKASRLLERDAEIAAAYVLDRLLALDQSVARAKLAVDSAADRTGPPLTDRLRALAAEDRLLRALYLVDGEGRVLLSGHPAQDPESLPSRAELAAAVASGPGARRLTLGRLSTLALARPVGPTEGGGAVVAVLDPQTLRQRLADAAHEPSVAISVYAPDGSLTAGVGAALGRRGPAGCRPQGGAPGPEPAAPDPDLRVTCSTVGGYGVSVLAAAPADLPLRAWWSDARYKLGGLLGLAAGGVTMLAMRRRIAQARQHTTILSAAIEQSSNAVLITDSRGTILWANEALARQSGFAMDELVGATPRILKSGIQPEAYYEAMWRTLLAGRVWRGEILNRQKGGGLYRVRQVVTPLMDSAGRPSHFVAIEEDVTEIVRQQAIVERVRTTDLFTGLPNRAGFHDGLAALRLAPGRDLVGVLDLTGLSAVNDSAGREAGDQALLHVSEALQRDRRAVLAARLGDDEFGFVLSVDTPAASPLPALAELHAMIEEGVRRIEGCGLLRVRIGFAAAEDDDTAGSALLERSEIALNAGRGGPRSAVVRYSRDLADRASRRQKMRTALRGAAEAGEIRFLLQPKVSLPEGRIVGGELLMRWTHPELGTVPPSEFIPLAEETGDIVGLGRAALEAALRIAARVPAQRQFRIALNASAVELSRPDYADATIDAVRRSGVPPRRLVVELTETAAAAAGSTLRNQLRRLLDAGLGVDIDDFGTGYATLSQLRDLPFTGIKIDRGFVAPLLEDRRSELIVRGVVALATGFGAEVVAEGIEDAATARALAGLGCGYGQGYLFGRPLDPEAVLAQLDG